MRKILLLALAAALPAQAADVPAPKSKKATFAGGCFWCIQPPFDKTKGVIKTTVGYTGGHTQSPSYEEVSSGQTGHAESIEVVYDPSKVSYQELLEVYWMSVDPTQTDGQFVDHGSQYRTAIFYHDEEQKRQALASKKKLDSSHRFDAPIATEIVAAGPFYPAEEYHQKYYLKSKMHYGLYHAASGRDSFFERVWGKDKASKP